MKKRKARENKKRYGDERTKTGRVRKARAIEEKKNKLSEEKA